MAAEHQGARAARLLTALTAEPGRVLRAVGDDCYAVPDGAGGRPLAVPAELLRRLLSAGLLERDGGGTYGASAAAHAWLARRHAATRPHHSQHAEIVRVADPDRRSEGSSVEINADESPIGRLSRLTSRDGTPFLPPATVKAAERLRGDFERGRLQPRLTADWSATVRPRRRSGGAGGVAELTAAAAAARTRFNQALAAVGPELAGVLVDVCCFLKGLETVERERGWPARSAKLVLGLALTALARHYRLDETATGRAAARGIRHWGAENYRPRIDG